MKIFVFNLGALTSKPYAFTARPWELESIETVDFFDSLGSNIRVDTRGKDIMRILPRINEDINEEWISDKIRFSYDGFKRQRLDVPLSKVLIDEKTSSLSHIGKFVPESWHMALKLVAFIILNLDAHPAKRALRDLFFVFGKFVDLETLFVAKRLVALLRGDSSAFTGATQPTYLFDSRSFYLSSPVKNLLKGDLFLFISCNLRFELPVLNLRVRRLVVAKKIRVFTIGSSFSFNYAFVDLGKTTTILKQIAEGRHRFSQTFLTCSLPAVFLGNGLFRRKDSASFQRVVDFLLKQVRFFFLSFAHTHSSVISALELGLLSGELYKQMEGVRERPSVLWILDNDEVVFSNSKENFLLTVYQGHHGDINASRASIILPATAPYEKESLFVSFDGRYQKSKLVFSAPGQSRLDWEILSSLEYLLGSASFIFSKELLYKALSKELGGLRFSGFEKNLVLNTFSNNFFFPSLISTFPLSSNVFNFYMSDSISRASHVMALTSLRFKQHVINYKN